MRPPSRSGSDTTTRRRSSKDASTRWARLPDNDHDTGIEMCMSRVPACVLGILLAWAVASAQVPGAPIPGQPPPFPGAAAPPRDNPNAAKTGTAILRGRVVAADTGQPLRKAQVRLLPNFPGASGPISGPMAGRATSTDNNGRYEFKELAAGRYMV